MQLVPLQKQHNTAIAAVIRQVSAEFGLAPQRGFAVSDPILDDLYRFYQHDHARYWVVIDQEQRVVGGGGVAPLQGAEEILEIQKMYFLPEARGRGLARKILNLSFEFARQQGKWQLYLETTEKLFQARGLYQSMGFTSIATPLGNTGHSAACEIYMIKNL